jgi:hypothetical protein
VQLEIAGDRSNIETIAIGGAIRAVARLRSVYGPRRWRKPKGVASIRLRNESLPSAELHWYEAHGLWKERKEAEMLFGLRTMNQRETAALQLAVCMENPD